MKLTDLDNLIVQALAESEHPEISEIEVVPTADMPNNHARVVVRFVSGARASVLIRQLVTPNGRKLPEFEIPKEER